MSNIELDNLDGQGGDNWVNGENGVLNGHQSNHIVIPNNQNDGKLKSFNHFAFCSLYNYLANGLQ